MAVTSSGSDAGRRAPRHSVGMQPSTLEVVPNFRSLLLYFPRMTEKEERLKQLAEMASNEQDLHKFIPLAREINLILEEKQEHLGKLRIPSKPSE